LQAQWRALTKQGQKEGWLEWSGGYLDGEWQVAANDRHPKRAVCVCGTISAATPASTRAAICIRVLLQMRTRAYPSFTQTQCHADP
jgi:hypothetical protein